METSPRNYVNQFPVGLAGTLTFFFLVINLLRTVLLFNTLFKLFVQHVCTLQSRLKVNIANSLTLIRTRS